MQPRFPRHCACIVQPISTLVQGRIDILKGNVHVRGLQNVSADYVPCSCHCAFCFPLNEEEEEATHRSMQPATAYGVEGMYHTQSDMSYINNTRLQI